MSIADPPEPNDPDKRVPVVDFTMDPAAGTAPELFFVGAAELDDVTMRYPSFEDFYRTNRTSIGRALALTLRNTALAAEAVDEAMARAYQRWPHVSQLENPGGWVYRVGLNWSRSVVRRLTRPAPVWVASPAASPAPIVQDPLVDRALGLLTVDQRAVVVCRLLLNLSEASTAHALGIRPGTVKSRLHRALARLNPLLAPLREEH
jgi:DNA-directed RNA polymerase specialized sigma24 family protein